VISIERSLIRHNFPVRLAPSLEGVCPGLAENCKSSRISDGWSQMCSVFQGAQRNHGLLDVDVLLLLYGGSAGSTPQKCCPQVKHHW
jgi:hypothetical protein